ncbi:hypothetical protein X777_07119 [Ooceraea biroi]|uniref:Uncharacterized protein n=1 Tax=Ooceraea biroi TaxID=2015173 RepID=A0A026W9U9_OOCBI|nr:hypothetical protein X777_07119 [Ooceraea biroi]
MNSVSGSHNDKELAPNNSDIDVVRPWLRPCGSGVVTMLKKPLQRHNAHKVLKRVRTQLRVAQNHFRKDLKDIFEIYSKHFYKVLKRQYNMPWLPCMQLEWYYNNVSCLPKNQKAERALPQLHDALQRFAITFYSLQKYNLQSDIESAVTMIRRNEIIDGMHNEILRIMRGRYIDLLRVKVRVRVRTSLCFYIVNHFPKLHMDLQKFAVAFEELIEDEIWDTQVQQALRTTQSYLMMMLCEVESNILALPSLQLPTRVERSIMSSVERNPVDDTRRLVRDWGVLLKYRDYLHAWRHVFKY